MYPLCRSYESYNSHLYSLSLELIHKIRTVCHNLDCIFDFLFSMTKNKCFDEPIKNKLNKNIILHENGWSSFQYHNFSKFESTFVTHFTDCLYFNNEQLMVNCNSFQTFATHYLNSHLAHRKYKRIKSNSLKQMFNTIFHSSI